MNNVEKLKEIILENNYFNTLAGERFRDWNGITNITAVISFSGRSKNQECYQLSTGSDSDGIFVTHLYVDRFGDVKVQLGSEDTDDFSVILHPTNEPIEHFDTATINEWINLLTF